MPMPNLHPDKLVGVARAVQSRPRKSRQSTESAAIQAASKQRPLTKPTMTPDSTLIERMAFQMRDANWDAHLERMARKPGKRVDKAMKAKSSKPKPGPMAPANEPPMGITIQVQTPGGGGGKVPPGIKFLNA